MKKIFNPQEIEKKLYNFWENNELFKPNKQFNKKKFCIMIPPPNITGGLHMGHAFQQTIMDILIRYHRMQGDNTLWQVGTDHAGIATQALVEKNIILKEGKNRHEYTRQDFIKKIWDWKKKYGSKITTQMRRLGNSVDWDRERFTLDPKMSSAVTEAFISLYQDNLIYRKKRLVNWDPKIQTVISDLEVENRLTEGFIWYIRYPLLEDCTSFYNKKYLVVATTRPETLLGDTALAINPKDSRYFKLLGKHVLVPFVNRIIPIIADTYVNLEKDTGCVKITPAHDFNDYQVGLRHNLLIINVLTFDGKIRDVPEIYNMNDVTNNIDHIFIPKKFKYLDRFVAREKIIYELKVLGLLEKVISHSNMIPYGDRSGSIIEPMLTDQWYLRISKLAPTAIKAVQEGNITFIPKQYNNLYFSWMQEIQDWCISRQLWWGHRIPIWYDNNKNIYLGRNEIEVRQKYSIPKNISLVQEEDVLDTWFSSSLWTFATLGWPDKTQSLEYFHPTNVLVSGFDIIFFWIARMIMLTMYFIKDKNGKPQVPFKIVYITGLIRDEQGIKMSKSKGNVIDPIDMIDGITLEKLIKKRTSNMFKINLQKKIRERTQKNFPKGITATGTDAVRFTFSALAAATRDIVWDMNRLKGYRNFCNKLWNASRFIFMNVKFEELLKEKDSYYVLSFADQWIISEFNNTVKIYRYALDNYRFDNAANILYDFIWYKFCDWYLELVKILINHTDTVNLIGTKYTLVNILESLLRLAHPIIPFITEEIWQRIKVLTQIKDKSIMVQKFPEYDIDLVHESVLHDMKWIQNAVTAIRNIRSSIKVSSNKLIPIFFHDVDHKVKRIIKLHSKYLKILANIESITILSKTETVPLSITKLIEGTEILVPISGVIDKNLEISRLYKEINKITLHLKRLEIKLSNKKFIMRAPKDIIEKDKLVAAQLQDRKIKLTKKVKLILDLDE
ncbi:MAG TPA: valine--tRNA ligase [Buchnera sp. (in: enterobacteria)]|nr:valine--tRNA ligase [Buchnera sp. (in: enterobacteria)]